MKRYEIAAFTRDSRSVSSDPVVEQNMPNDLLAHAHGAADKFLESYFQADDFAKNPFQIMKDQTVSVQVQSILQTSPRSYEVYWDETSFRPSADQSDSRHQGRLGGDRRAQPSVGRASDQKYSNRDLLQLYPDTRLPASWQL